MKKAEAIKIYWDALEGTIKSLKNFTGNSSCQHIMTQLWEELDQKSKSIRTLEGNDLEIGTIYRLSTYNKDVLIGRLEGFQTGSSVEVDLRVIASSRTQWNYKDVSEIYRMDVNTLISNTDKELTRDELEFPLYIGYEFHGVLMAEMMKGK